MPYEIIIHDAKIRPSGYMTPIHDAMYSLVIIIHFRHFGYRVLIYSYVHYIQLGRCNLVGGFRWRINWDSNLCLHHVATDWLFPLHTGTVPEFNRGQGNTRTSIQYLFYMTLRAGEAVGTDARANVLCIVLHNTQRQGKAREGARVHPVTTLLSDVHVEWREKAR